MRVLVLESRRAQELVSIVTSYGGDPVVAPSMREVPLESNTEAIACADALERGDCDLLVLLTGVGTRTLADAVERVRGTRESLLAALRHTRIAARGPKSRRTARLTSVTRKRINAMPMKSVVMVISVTPVRISELAIHPPLRTMRGRPTANG